MQINEWSKGGMEEQKAMQYVKSNLKGIGISAQLYLKKTILKTLNMNGLKNWIKRQRLSDWIKEIQLHSVYKSHTLYLKI